MTSDFTRSGARRSGDDYQDIVALDVLVEMLEHPDRYRYVEVEAYQTGGSLDDVVAVRTDGTTIAKQVKYSTNPSSDDDPWTWSDLLFQEDGKKGPLDSLLQKWLKSTLKLGAATSPVTAEVVSNRLPGDDLKASMASDGRVALDKIPDATRNEILVQIGGEAEAREFFSAVSFHLDKPGLGVLEDSVRQRFHNLGGTDEGWLSLKNEIRHWVCHKSSPAPDGRIRLDDVKAAAKWRWLEGLPQDFEVPVDYVLPSQAFLDQIMSKIESCNESCNVVVGRPGVGKSTFLSYLYEHLREKNIPVVRHHYYLSLSRQSIGRFDYRRIASSLMHDLRADYPESLGGLRSENPNVMDLGKWVQKCGAYFKQQSTCLVVIIDGLDHVWRENESINELNALLEHLLPVQEGILLLLGTQPLAKEPTRLVAASPERLELPLLDKEAVHQWVKHHVADVHLPANEMAAESALQAVADAFFAKSEGHPLHLTYTLRALLEQVMPVKPDSIEALPGCSHKDITTYYEQLWNALDEPGREILHLMAAAQFPWQSGWIIDCLDPNALNIPARNMALKQTRHLLMDRGLGLLPFHSSVIAYVQGLEDHALYSEHMKRQAIQWLQDKAPEYWRWAYEWILRADDGDTSAIASGPDRNWIVGSIAKAYPYVRAAEVLARAAWTCLGNDLPRSVELGMLNDYLYNTHQFRDDALDQLLYAQLLVEQDPYLLKRLNADISGQSDAALVNIAERAGLLRDHQLTRACSDDLYRRIYELHLGRGAGGVNMQLGSAESFLETCAYDRTKPAWVIDFISDYRDRGDSVWMLRAYCKGLFRISGALQLRDVLAAKLTPREREVAVDYAVRLAVRTSLDIRDAFTREEDRSDPYVSVYRWLHGADPGEVTQSTNQRDVKWLQLEEHEQYDQTATVESNYRRSFWSFLANHLWGKADADRGWLTEVGQESWPKAFLALLHEIAGELAQLLRENQPPPLAWLYGRLSTFARPKWPEDRDVHWYGNCAAKVINRLGLDILYLNADVSKRSIGRTDLEAALESKYFVPVLWTEFYLNERDPLLNDRALDWLLTMLSAELEHSMDQFNERAQRYSVLAGVVALHGRAKATKDLIHRTADNIFTYGDHKDVLLFGILECIEACHNAGIAEARDWLVSLAPVIAEVEEFTDGDETGGLPREYGDVMARMAPDLLSRYHQWLVANEEYYDALSVFHSFIRHDALSDPIGKAIAATAIDDESIIILADRAANGDPGSAEIFADLAKRYGHNHDSIERIRASLDRSSGSTGLSKKEFTSAAEYPPGRLQDYIASCKPEYDLWVNECVEHWLTYWISQDRLLEVYNDYAGLLDTGMELGNEDLIHNLVLRLMGKGDAYPWLVRAHREGHGWNRYWTSKDKAVRRWELIKQYYPEKWFEFIVDTSISDSDVPWQPLGFYDRFERLVEYCVFVGQIDLAKQITQRVIRVLFDLVSPLTLPTPEWVHRS